MMYGVGRDGKRVRLEIGNMYFMFDHVTAMNIANQMRLHAKKAKALAGDTSMHLHAIGNLTDANADELEEQSLRDTTIARPPAANPSGDGVG